MKKTVSILLVVLLLSSTLILSSCGWHPIAEYQVHHYYPEGYTAGFGQHRIYDAPYPKFYWLETYDELVEAMKSLESHGSTFKKMAFSDYEGELFDVKYCITMGSSETVAFGENPYDRKASRVFIQSYAFFEDVTLDELLYSNVSKYDTLLLHYCDDGKIDKFEPVPFENLTWEYMEYVEEYRIMSGENYIFFIQRTKNLETIEISDDVMEAIVNSTVCVGLE